MQFIGLSVFGSLKRDSGVRLRHHRDRDSLVELLVRTGKDCAGRNRRAGDDDVLNHKRGELLAAAVDQLFEPARQVEVPVGVKEAFVAGPPSPVDVGVVLGWVGFNDFERSE